MKVTAEQIERFFKRQCTAEEAMLVAAFLKANPAVLDTYLSETEWNEIEINDSKNDVFWNATWLAIQKRKHIATRIIQLKRSTAAACIAGIFYLGYCLFTNKNDANIEANNKIPSARNKATARAIQHKTVENTSKKPIHIWLQDSSGISLSPGAVIRYDIPFPSDKREIFLQGEAVFKVAKDTSKPFTVYAGSLATTALGTEFKIKSNSKNGITVELFTGKVVIHSTTNSLKGWGKNVYLSPGEQMQYDTDKMLVDVGKIVPKSTTVAKKAEQRFIHTDVPADNNNLNFNSTSLPDVMEKLAEFFKVKIVYDAAQIQTMNFTGSITKKDSLAIVLKVIGQMNDLDINQEGEVFIVKKAPE